jgi:hypothetical protein
MNCFSHQTIPAIGICKACHKAVCAECVIDTGRGLACSADCEKEINDLNIIMDKSKRIYNVGTSSKLPSIAVLMFLFFGLIFLSVGIYEYIQMGRIDFVSLAMGLGFIVFSVLSYIRYRNLNLNC